MKKLHVQERSRNQPILRFDVILQHDWSIKQCLLHIRVFFGGKTKTPCFDLFIHWLKKQITNTYSNHFSRSYENRSIATVLGCVRTIQESFCVCRKSIPGIGLLFTHKNGDFGLISVTERSCAAPVSKVERYISDRFCVTL